MHKVDLAGREKSVSSVEMCKAALNDYTHWSVKLSECNCKNKCEKSLIKALAEPRKSALKRNHNSYSFSSSQQLVEWEFLMHVCVKSNQGFHLQDTYNKDPQWNKNFYQACS